MPSSQGADCARRARLRLAAVAATGLLGLPAPTSAEPLRLTDALVRAAAQDLSRPASEARLRAAQAAARQAAAAPNPSLAVEVENVAGTGARQLADSAETTVSYERTVERGGKREARTEAARAEIAVARLRGEVRALDLLRNVQALWVEAAAAEDAADVAEERLSVARRLEEETARRVRAAMDPLFAGERARTATAEARIGLDQARAGARDARLALAAYLGLADVEIDASGFERLDAESAPATSSADVALSEAEREAAAARVRVEQSRTVQDVTLRAGVRHYRQGGDLAFVMGGSIPIGRKDANRANVERARQERLAAEAEAAAARAEREREIARLAARRRTQASEIRRIDAEVLPSARRAVQLVRDGFVRGGGAFTYLEVAEAQRALIDARARRAELLKSFHLDGASLDRLTGRHAALVTSAEARR